MKSKLYVLPTVVSGIEMPVSFSEVLRDLPQNKTESLLKGIFENDFSNTNVFLGNETLTSLVGVPNDAHYSSNF